jgi:hypothetical protein
MIDECTVEAVPVTKILANSTLYVADAVDRGLEFEARYYETNDTETLLVMEVIWSTPKRRDDLICLQLRRVRNNGRY